MTRVVTGVILLAVALVALFFPHPLPLSVLVWMLALIGLWEFMGLMELGNLYLLFGGLSLTAILVGSYIGSWPLAFGGAFLPLIYQSLILFLERGSLGEIRTTLGLFLLAPLYLGIPFGLAIRYKCEGHIWPLLFVAAAVWIGDTAAYYVGKALGRHPLHPTSPQKTWEGTLGGLLAGALAAMIIALIGGFFSWWAGFLVGVIVNVSGQLGDLLESSFKRARGMKDTGTIFPGHGGVLDRVDSLLLALPVFALIDGIITLL